MKWKGYALPIELAQRISRIRGALGYSSDSAFVQEAVRRQLNSKEREYDAIQEEREVGRRVLGKKDPGDL